MLLQNTTIQAAWRWLDEQGLREDESQASLSLFSGPAQALNCGEAPHYMVWFARRNDQRLGRLCLDAYSGQVISNTFEN